MAIFFNHGQCCCAGSRLYIEKPIFDDVVKGVSEAAKKMKVGPGLTSPDMGPLVSSEQFEKVKGYIKSGQDDGAKVAVGGGTVGDKGYFVEPTVLTNTNDKMKVITEEIFGPVVAAEPFDNAEEVMKRSNNSNYGLAAAVWTKDIKKAINTADAFRAGTVWVNCYNIFDAALPFGGYKQSGWGREMGSEILDAYTETKSVVIAK
jgi:phenylacetaldehyde dehydrogenase